MFTGREFLKEVGLYDYRNRVYSTELGRFLQTDPIRFNAGDVNIYRFCFNDALNHIDPNGTTTWTRVWSWISVGGGVVWAVGGVLALPALATVGAIIAIFGGIIWIGSDVIDYYYESASSGGASSGGKSSASSSTRLTSSSSRCGSSSGSFFMGSIDGKWHGEENNVVKYSTSFGLSSISNVPMTYNSEIAEPILNR